MTGTLPRGSLLVDYAWRHPDPKAIYAAGYRGVMRYLSLDDSKDLSADERDELFAAGLAILLVWETTADRAGQGEGAGHTDASAANAKAAALGFPPELPIRYAVDEQIDPALVLPYFRGARTAGPHPVAGYGDAAVVDALAAAGFPPGWQTEAWSGSTVSSSADLYQRAAPTLTIAGAAGDYDEDLALRDVAVWPPPAAAAPAPPAPPPPPPPPAPGPTPQGLGFMLRQLQTAQPMMRGGDVRAVQAILNAKAGAGLALDGIFGPATAGAVEAWQRAHGLTVDGIVGTGQTWPSLVDA